MKDTTKIYSIEIMTKIDYDKVQTNPYADEDTDILYIEIVARDIEEALYKAKKQYEKDFVIFEETISIKKDISSRQSRIKDLENARRKYEQAIEIIKNAQIKKDFYAKQVINYFNTKTEYTIRKNMERNMKNV